MPSSIPTPALLRRACIWAVLPSAPTTSGWLTTQERHLSVTFAYNTHQHTSKGSVPGISGHVDLNVTTRNYPKIICKKGLTRLREGK